MQIGVANYRIQYFVRTLARNLAPCLETMLLDGAMSNPPDDDRIRRLLDVGRALVAELDPETVLDRILEEAREITGARYAALGVMNEERSELERFLTVGVDGATHRAIGELPHGRGVLGVLIEDPRPLRLPDVARHPQSYGFPPGHPPMHGFLGVPIVIRGEAWGNLYLTEKHDGGEFTEADEEAAVILADWAGTAIENARPPAARAGGPRSGSGTRYRGRDRRRRRS
jgi:GAF domain-containing protein